MFFHEEHEEIIKETLDEVLQIDVDLAEMKRELRQALGSIHESIEAPQWVSKGVEAAKVSLYSIDKSHQIITEDVFHMRKEINSPAWLPELVSSLSEISEAMRGLIKIIQDKEFFEEICIKSLADINMKDKPKKNAIRKKAIRKKTTKSKTISQS